MVYLIGKSYHNGGRFAPTKGGDAMVTYEAVIAFAMIGLFVVEVVALFLNKR